MQRMELGKLGFSVVVHNRSSGGVLRAPADVLTTVTCSGASCSGCNNGADMAGGAELSGSMVRLARACYRRRGHEGIDQGLTGGGGEGQRAQGRLGAEARSPAISVTRG